MTEEALTLDPCATKKRIRADGRTPAAWARQHDIAPGTSQRVFAGAYPHSDKHDSEYQRVLRALQKDGYLVQEGEIFSEESTDIASGGIRNYWLLPDSHFGHDKIHEPDFGGRPHGYEQRILQNLRHVLTPRDVLIHLGDVCFYREEYWHNELMKACGCKRWLIRGNHDKKTMGWYYAAGWDLVVEEIKLQIYGAEVVLSHRPIIGRDDFDLNIHGHLHGNTHHDYPVDERHVSLYLEHHYFPVSLRKIVETKR